MVCSGRCIAHGELQRAPPVSNRVAGRVHLWISGRVQGVGFRFFVERAARRYGVDGLVRNLPDGRVEVIAEGDKEMLEAFLNELRRGPAGADVVGLQAAWEIPEGLTGFRIQ